MKTQTQVSIVLNDLEPLQNLHIQQSGYILKFFMGCSQIYSKPFKIRESQTDLNKQRLTIKNISGDQLEIWLCNTENKIIANASVQLKQQGYKDIQLQFKLNNISFAKLLCQIGVDKKEIEKLVHIQPDEQLLKKQQDPATTRVRQQEEKKRLKEKQELEKSAQNQKKYAITKTFRNVKNEPFL